MLSPGFLLRLAAIVLIAAAGLAGYEYGKSEAGTAREAKAERRGAYDAAFQSRLDSSERAANRRGYEDGLKEGRADGNLAGLLAAKKVLAKREKRKKEEARARKVIWAVGDGADGGSAGRAVAAMIASRSPDRFLYLGDVYDGRDLAEFDGDYGNTFGRFNSLASPTPGNHEWSSHESGYDPYWERAKGRPQPPWYEVRVAGWQLLSLNSETSHGPGSPQLRWLEGKLRRTPQIGDCRLGFWHRPYISAGNYEGDGGDLAPIWNALSGRTRLVVTGHDHNMQRFAPRDGITHLISGAGGHGHYPVGSAPGLQFANDDTYGALRLLLGPGRADFAFFSTAGKRLDSGSVTCRRE